MSVRIPGIGIPRRMFANMRSVCQGYLAVGAPATGTATIYSNAENGPFFTSNSITSGWSSLNLTDGSSTSNPMIPNSFFALAYQNYRVHTAQLKISAVTGAGGDTMNVFLYPAPNLSIPGTTTINKASGCPGYKQMTITSGMRPEKIISKVRCSDVLGMTAEQYRTDQGTQAALASDPGIISSWSVSYATMDGAVTTGQCYFTFEVEYEVEFFDPLSPST